MDELKLHIPYFLSKHPLIPFIIFQNRSATITYVCTILHGLILCAGLAILLETITLVPASIITGFLITWTGCYRWAIWGGWIITTIGMGLLVLLDVDTSTAGWVGLNLIVGLGTGMIFGAMPFAVQASLNIDSIVAAVCMFSFFRSSGSTIGIAIGGTIFNDHIRQQLNQWPQFASVGTKFVNDGIALITAIKSLPDTNDRSILIKAYAGALQTIWQDMSVIGIAGLLLSLFIQSYTLDVPLQGDKALTNDDVVDRERTVDSPIPANTSGNR